MEKKRMYVEYSNGSWAVTLKQFTGIPEQRTNWYGKSTEFGKELDYIYDKLGKPIERCLCPVCGKALLVHIDPKTKKRRHVTCVRNRVGVEVCTYGADYDQYLQDMK